MKIKNLTPHPINIVGWGVIKPEQKPARVKEIEEKIGELQNGIPLFQKKFEGEVVGLPPKERDTIYIVSLQTCQACPDRDDLFIPASTVRDEKGQIIGCNGLSKNPYSQ